MAHWKLIDADMHDFYGVDSASGILADRPADWLRNRIGGLLYRDSALARAVLPKQGS